MPRFTWLGDEDASQQVITMFGHEFVKGEPVTVSDKDPFLAKLKGNRFFTTDAKADVVESDEPDAPDVEAGTEKAAIKAELTARGIKWQGNPSLDTLRGKLAAAKAD